MPSVSRPDGASISYDVRGDGPALIALAPGLVNSDGPAWSASPFDVATFAGDFTVVTMDQRFSGRSTGPNLPFSYDVMTADQLAVLDAAAVAEAVAVGVEIGANYALRLACLHPERVRAAVLIAPLGRLDGGPRHPFLGPFEATCRLARADGLEAVLAAARREPRFDRNPEAGPFAALLHDDPAVVEETLRKGRERYITRVVRFRDGMFPDGAPWFGVTAEEVLACRVPLLVVPGSTDRSPRSVAALLATEAPAAQLAERADLQTVRRFLSSAGRAPASRERRPL